MLRRCQQVMVNFRIAVSRSTCSRTRVPPPRQDLSSRMLRWGSPKWDRIPTISSAGSSKTAIRVG